MSEPLREHLHEHSRERFELSFPVHSWLRDHHFAGRAVLPMVIALDFLAALTLKKFPEIEGIQLENAVFPKLLALPEGDTLAAIIELERLDAKRARAALLTRKSGAVSRLLHHAEVIFAHKANLPGAEQLPPVTAEDWQREPCRIIACEKIYAELVPFGPTFRTLHGHLYLRGNKALGTLIAPDLPFSCPAMPNLFLLDGAMHAACVHGQSFCGFVPFPVGFAAMEIKNVHSLQKPGITYRTGCILTEKSSNMLRYNLCVCGGDGVIEVTGLMMKDVSGGSIKPPAWIHNP